MCHPFVSGPLGGNLSEYCLVLILENILYILPYVFGALVFVFVNQYFPLFRIVSVSHLFLH